MPTVEIPVTTYQVRAEKPNTKQGSPAVLFLRNSFGRVLVSVPIDRIPLDGVITSAELRLYSERAHSGSRTARVLPINSAWNSSVIWAKQPSYGADIQSLTKTNSADRVLWAFNVTNWAKTRSRNGLLLSSEVNGAVWLALAGSANAVDKPVLVVTYTNVAITPGTLAPNGGKVAVPQPVLNYAGDDDMTEQYIEFSTNGGVSATWNSGWVAAVDGVFYTDQVVGAPTLASGATIHWRVKTRGPDGESAFSTWASYTYVPIPPLAITNPPDLSDDGSPTLQWTTTNQTSWRASLWQGATRVAYSDWKNEPLTRDWTPSVGVRVPGANAYFLLHVRDNQTGRLDTQNVPAYAVARKDFATQSPNVATGVTNMGIELDDPVAVITGTRALGIPDFVGLYRDGVQVPLWDPETGLNSMWVAGAQFFTGNNFAIPDYTATPRSEHKWRVVIKVGTAVRTTGPDFTGKVFTPGLYLLDPRTGDRVEIQGYDGRPSLNEATSESSILHTPVNGNLVVEPTRRRLLRTTASGSVSGVVLDEDADLLDKWAVAASGNKYRLIYGRSNRSVIFGDYSPQEEFYGNTCGPDRTAVSFNWWERLADV